MSRVHPNAATTSSHRSTKLAVNRGKSPVVNAVNSGKSPVVDAVNSSKSPVVDDANAVVLTVWKKSLLLNCSGFTVFDSRGNLVFRVDNYASSNRSEIVLMDASGTPLLTLRRKRLSLSGEPWSIYDGDSAANPRFTTRKQAQLLNTRCLVRVSSGRSSPSSPPPSPTNRNVMYEVEGSYPQRCCAVYDREKRKVAEIKKKEAAVGGAVFGGDVFRLVVQPQMEAAVAMGLVILMEQMYGSPKF